MKEAFATYGLPVTPVHSKKCGSPVLDLAEISESSLSRSAGNGMTLAAVGAVMLVAALGLEKV